MTIQKISYYIYKFEKFRKWAISKIKSMPTSENLDNKVDKVQGKGLSTNDYTDAEKSKLAGLTNFDLTSISGYSASDTQTLKNNSGTFKWVTD